MSSDDFQETVNGRIERLTHFLGLMNGRAHETVQGSCFLKVTERTDEQDDVPALREAAHVVAVLAGEAAGLRNDAGLYDLLPIGIADEAWRQDEQSSRFVQFSFERYWFCLDMPCQTLYKPEAAKILRDRSGFFYLRDNPRFTLFEEDVEGYDPFRKVYLYGDERAAAEDVAYIYFQLWHFPPDSTLYVSAAAFGKNFTFEQGLPI